MIGWDCRQRQLNLDSQRSSYLELVGLSCLWVDKQAEGRFSGNERGRTSSNHDDDDDDDEEEEEEGGVGGE